MCSNEYEGLHTIASDNLKSEYIEFPAARQYLRANSIPEAHTPTEMDLYETVDSGDDNDNYEIVIDHNPCYTTFGTFTGYIYVPDAVSLVILWISLFSPKYVTFNYLED